jgi:hypothetical protein
MLVQLGGAMDRDARRPVLNSAQQLKFRVIDHIKKRRKVLPTLFGQADTGFDKVTVNLMSFHLDRQIEITEIIGVVGEVRAEYPNPSSICSKAFCIEA